MARSCSRKNASKPGRSPGAEAARASEVDRSPVWDAIATLVGGSLSMRRSTSRLMAVMASAVSQASARKPIRRRPAGFATLAWGQRYRSAIGLAPRLPQFLHIT